MKPMIAIAVFFLPLLAQATDVRTPDTEQQQSQGQGQEQGQFQTSSIAAEQTLGVENEITFTSPDDITIRDTAAARPPSVYPSGNCYGGWSAGFGVPGVNVSGGKATLDDNCDARETARMFYEFGEREKAIMILCHQPAAEVLAGCKPAQDYAMEMKLLELDNAELRQSLDDLKQQATNDSAKCEQAKDRIFEGTCAGSK